MSFHSAKTPRFTLNRGERSRLERRFSANSRAVHAAAPLPVSRAQFDAARQQLKATMHKRAAPSPTAPLAGWQPSPAALNAQAHHFRARLLSNGAYVWRGISVRRREKRPVNIVITVKFNVDTVYIEQKLTLTVTGAQNDDTGESVVRCCLAMNTSKIGVGDGY